jgi:hypothetical protein
VRPQSLANRRQRRVTAATSRTIARARAALTLNCGAIASTRGSGAPGVVLVDRERVDARPDVGRDGVEIERGGQPPSTGLVQEAVVAQVIVDIRDQHVEHDAPPQLIEIARGRRAGALQDLRELEVAAGVSIARGHRRERRHVRDALGATPVEALDDQDRLLQHGRKLAPGDLDPGGLGHRECRGLPSGDRPLVLGRRELRDRKPAPSIAHGRLRARAAERGPGSQEQREVVVGLLLVEDAVRGAQQPGELDERRDAAPARRQEFASGRVAEPQRAQSRLVVHEHEHVDGQQGSRGATLRTRAHALVTPKQTSVPSDRVPDR